MQQTQQQVAFTCCAHFQLQKLFLPEKQLLAAKACFTYITLHLPEKHPFHAKACFQLHKHAQHALQAKAAFIANKAGTNTIAQYTAAAAVLTQAAAIFNS